jgi:microcystin-dependent protein
MYYNSGTEGTPVWEGADVPVGTINMYAGATTDVPSGWLLCDGSAVSRTTYDELFNRLDTEYGVGDGSTTFNLPDFVTSNIFPRGATNDAGRGTTGGESTHTLTEAEMPAHDHDFSDSGHSHNINLIETGSSPGVNGISANPFNNKVANGSQNTDSATTGVTLNSQGSNTAHENKPPFLDVHFIIAV